MKKILIVHSFYGSESPSGENAVVEEDFNYLKDLGFQVSKCSLSSDALRSNGVFGEIMAGFNYLLGIKGLISLNKTVKEFRPDIIHIHNVFPMFSLWVLYYARSVSTVYYTWHNYRNLCIAGFPIRDGQVCRKCIDSSQIHGLRHRCYKGSFFGSVVLYLSNTIHKRFGTINRTVDKLICFTNFQKQVLSDAGVKRDILFVKPNFSDISFSALSWSQRERYVVFAGRISHEKGIEKLLAIWATDADLPGLKVCGSGPQLLELQGRYGHLCNIEFYGLLAKPVLDDIMSRARAVIVPSIAWEGYPMVIADAEKLGTPVFSSGIGPLGDMVVHPQQIIKFEDLEAARESLTLKLQNDELLREISGLQQIKSKGNLKRREYLDLYE